MLFFLSDTLNVDILTISIYLHVGLHPLQKALLIQNQVQVRNTVAQSLLYFDLFHICTFFCRTTLW